MNLCLHCGVQRALYAPARRERAAKRSQPARLSRLRQDPVVATGALPDAMRDVGDGHRGRASKNRAQSSHKAAAALVRTARASKKTTDDRGKDVQECFLNVYER